MRRALFSRHALYYRKDFIRDNGNNNQTQATYDDSGIPDATNADAGLMESI